MSLAYLRVAAQSRKRLGQAPSVEMDDVLMIELGEMEREPEIDLDGTGCSDEPLPDDERTHAPFGQRGLVRSPGEMAWWVAPVPR